MPRAERHALHESAGVFAALGDRTRLMLVGRLSRGEALSIARLSQGSRISRQAVTKHLRILGDAGLVRATRRGRERLFSLEPRAINAAAERLSGISRLWDAALARLKDHVER